MSPDQPVADAADRVAEAQRIVVLTGAGISTDSGIPDFRGPNGLWTKNPEAEKASHITHYVNDRSVRVTNWALRASGDLWADVEPNPGHQSLADFARLGRLTLVITQNVDGLHQAAGTPQDQLVEIHGNTRRVACLECGDSAPVEVVLDRVRAGEEDPACLVCGGILKSATVSFGQPLDSGDLARCEQAALDCDLLLAVGTSLTVNPISGVAPLAVRTGANLVIVNAEPTPFDEIADAVVRGSISAVLPHILGV